MKKFWKANSILSGIFMATLSVFTGYLSVALAIDNDPNMALPVNASAAASAPMQAAGPIQIKSPSPAASAASAPRPAASAALAPAAAAPATAAAPAPAPAPKKVVATELTDEEFKAYSFAFKNIDGVSVDKTEWPSGNSRWRKPLEIDGVQKFVSNDQKQKVDFFGPYDNGETNVVTYNQDEGQATVTEFKNKKPISYTVLNKRGEYSATPGFCKLLAFQTNSKDFAELAERAVTCKAFYDKTKLDESTKAAAESTLQNLRDVHRRNLAVLGSSVAKPMVDAALKKAPGTGLKSWWAARQGEKVDALAKMRPRNVLFSTASSSAEAEDRAVLFDLAEACGRLWKDGDAVIPAPQGKPTSGNPVRK